MPTFAVLDALSRMPKTSITDTSIVSGSKRWTAVQGPVKVEYNLYQNGDGETFTASDTFVTGLAHPIAVTAQWANADANTATDPTAELEGDESVTTYRTVTVLDADGVDDAAILVTVYGY